MRDPAPRAIFDLDITCVLCEVGTIVTEPRGRAMAKITSSRYPCNICLGGGGEEEGADVLLKCVEPSRCDNLETYNLQLENVS